MIPIGGSQAFAPGDDFHVSRTSAFLAAFIIVGTVFFGIVPTGLEYHTSGAREELLTGSWINRFQWLPLFVLAGYLLWRVRFWAVLYLRQINPFLLAMLVLMMLSALWSPVPFITVRRTITMFGMLAIGMALHLSGWYPQRLVRLLYICFGLAILASIIAAVVFPSFGIHQVGDFAGLWRGIREDKNLLANLAALTMLLGAHAWLTSRRYRMFHLLYFALAFLTLFMSGAKGSLVSGTVGLIFMFALARPLVNNRYWLPVTLFIGFTIIAIPLFFYSLLYGVPTYADIFGPFFGLLGKELTLTGRDEIWVWLLPIISEHWVLGYGYGAFWLGEYGLSGEIIEALGYYPWQAHNGFLEITNELGVVGLALSLAFFAYHIRQLFHLRRVNSVAFLFHMPLVAMILVNNISESAILNGLNLYTIVLMLSSLAISRALWPYRVVRQQPSGSLAGAYNPS